MEGCSTYHYNLDLFEENGVNKNSNPNELNCHDYLTKDDNKYGLCIKQIALLYIKETSQIQV